MEAASRVGWGSWRSPGRQWAPEILIMFILRSLRRLSCDNNPDVRLRRHLLLLAQKDCSKTTVIRAMTERILGGVSYDLAERGDDSNPTFMQIDGGGVSWESMRGGAIEGNLEFPSLHEIDFLVAGELKAFLSNGEKMLTRMDNLNVAMEEGKITVKTLGMASVKAARKEAFTKMCDDTAGRVRYNSDKNILVYQANFSLIAATRPLEPKDAALLENSGFLSRFFTSRWDPNDDEYRAYKRDPFGDGDPAAEDYLKRFCAFAWKCRFKVVNQPPREMRLGIVGLYSDEYERISLQTSLPISEIQAGREMADGIQLLTAFAAMRQLQACFEAGDAPQEFPELKFEKADFDQAIAYRRGHLAEVETKAMLNARDDPSRDLAFNSIVAYVKSKSSEDGDCRTISTKDLADYIQSGCPFRGSLASKPVAKAASYNRIGRMRQFGHIYRIGLTHTERVSDSVLISAGVLKESDLEAPRRNPDEETFHPADLDDDEPPVSEESKEHTAAILADIAAESEGNP